MPKATKKSAKKASAPKATEIVVLLDRSGSMATIRRDMEQGFNTFIDGQKKVPGDCSVTLVQFDTQGVDTLYEAKPLADVPALVLEPRGGTPLLDAMGRTITRVDERVKDGRQILFLVITDGEENSSHEFKRDQVKTLVTNHTTKGWTFSFLGANLDSFAEAGSLGIAMAGSANFIPDSHGVNCAYAAVGAASASLRSGGTYTVANLDSRAVGHSGASDLTTTALPRKAAVKKR